MVCPLSSRGFIVKLVTEIVIKYSWQYLSRIKTRVHNRQWASAQILLTLFFFSQKMANMKVLKDYLCMIKITLYKIDLL